MERLSERAEAVAQQKEEVEGRMRRPAEELKQRVRDTAEALKQRVGETQRRLTVKAQQLSTPSLWEDDGSGEGVGRCALGFTVGCPSVERLQRSYSTALPFTPSCCIDWHCTAPTYSYTARSTASSAISPLIARG